MRPDDLEVRMRQLEWFHDLRALPDRWPIIRVDGRGFSKLTELRFAKPFDPTFHAAMTAAAGALLVGLQGIYAYIESDEISVLLPKDADLFDREVEKLVSISAGIASSIFTKESGEAAHFDSRLWLGPSIQSVVEYFQWRQADATRCCLNGWCYWTLRKEGFNPVEGTVVLADRRRIKIDEALPKGDDYDRFLMDRIRETAAGSTGGVP